MKRSCLFLLILALLPVPACAEDPPPALTVIAGLGGCAIPGRWSPVAVEVDNPGAELAGELSVRVDTPWGSTEVYRQAVVLPRSSRKRFSFTVLSRNSSGFVQVRDAAGRVRAEQPLSTPCPDAPAIWAIVGSAWMGLEGFSRNRGAPVFAVRLEPAQAPVNPLGYDAADCVFVAPPDPARPWTREAREALLAWVRDGGRVVTEWKTLADGFFPGVEGHAGEWHGGMLQATAFARFLGGTARPEREVPAFELTLTGCEPRWSDGAHTWIQSAPVGLGEILVLGFAVDQSPLRDSPAVRVLWEKLLGVELGDPAAPAENAGRFVSGIDGEVAGAPALLETGALSEIPERTSLGLLLFAYPWLFAVGYYRWLVRARAAGRRRGRFPALVWIVVASAAAAALVLGHLARSPAPSLRAYHFARGLAGDATLRGGSVAALLLPPGGDIDLELADSAGALALAGRGLGLWRHPGRRFAREEVALDVGSASSGFHGLDLGRGDLCCVRADWRAPVPAAAAVRCFPEGDGLRVRNDGEIPIFGLSFWNGERLLLFPEALGPGKETTIDPRRQGVQVREPVPDSARDSAAFGAWLRRYAVRPLGPTARADPEAARREEVFARLVVDAGRIPAPGKILFFHTVADPGVLRWSDSGVALESWTFVELHLVR